MDPATNVACRPSPATRSRASPIAVGLKSMPVYRAPARMNCRPSVAIPQPSSRTSRPPHASKRAISGIAGSRA